MTPNIITRDLIIGEVRQILGATAPDSNWLLLNGQTFLSSEYPRLAALLGTNTLPDARGAALSGVADGETVGSVVGANVKQVPLPAHTHSIDIKSPTGDVNTLAASGSYGNVIESYNTGSAGGSADFDVRGKRLLVNYIIRGR